MTIKAKYILGAILIAILLLFGSGWYLGRKHSQSVLTPVLNAFTDTIKRYTIEINDQKTYVTEREQEVKTLREALKAGEISREELRKLNIKYLNELTRLKIAIDTLLSNVSHNGQVVTLHDTVTINNNKKAIILPFSFYRADQWLDSLKGNFDKNGVLSVKLRLNLDLNIWSVVQKGSKTPSVFVTTTCPYVGIMKIDSKELDILKDKRWGIGVFAGYGINLSGTIKASPLMGVGLNYSIIKF